MSIFSRIKNVPARNIMPKILQHLADPDTLVKRRSESEELRKKEGRPHQIFYFHELSDPYSHITAQLVSKIEREYEIQLIPLLVGEPPVDTVHEPSLYRKYCHIDAMRIAPFYLCDFPNDITPDKNIILLAQRILCSLHEEEFISKLSIINNHVWLGNEEALKALITDKTVSNEEASQLISKNEEKRTEVKAYMGSTFSYEGELYWGIDRLNHLEDRLVSLELKINPEQTFISERKANHLVEVPKQSNLKLEFYPSLNSPYTAISVERIGELREKYPIEVVTRPVLPMLMRDMRIPSYKARYILSDSAREGSKYGVPFAKVFSPLGKPAERAYSLFPWVDQKGKGFEYMSSLMISCFRKGENIGKKSYLKSLIIELGLNWEEANKHLDSYQWKDILEKNRLIMYEGYSWGVPTFRLVDEKDTFTTWGQDRIWLIEEEIIKRLIS